MRDSLIRPYCMISLVLKYNTTTLNFCLCANSLPQLCHHFVCYSASRTSILACIAWGCLESAIYLSYTSKACQLLAFRVKYDCIRLSASYRFVITKYRRADLLNAHVDYRKILVDCRNLRLFSGLGVRRKRNNMLPSEKIASFYRPTVVTR